MAQFGDPPRRGHPPDRALPRAAAAAVGEPDLLIGAGGDPEGHAAPREARG